MKKLYLVLAIICFIIVLAVDVYTDVKIGDQVNHARGALWRTLGLAPAVVLFWLYNRKRWWVIPAILFFNYWNLFDGFYNLFNHHGWFFTGSEDGAADAKTDNFLQSIPLWLHAAIKIGGSIFSILIYFLNFKNKKQ